MNIHKSSTHTAYLCRDASDHTDYVRVYAKKEEAEAYVAHANREDEEPRWVVEEVEYFS